MGGGAGRPTYNQRASGPSSAYATGGEACETRVLDYGCLVRRAQSDGRRLQALRGAQDGFPPVGSRSNGQMDRFSLLFRNLESSCEEFLFFQAEKLIMSQFVLASTRALQEPHVKRHDVLFVRIDTVENCVEVMKRVVVAHHHQDISRPNAQSFGGEIVAGFEIEFLGAFEQNLVVDQLIQHIQLERKRLFLRRLLPLGIYPRAIVLVDFFALDFFPVHHRPHVRSMLRLPVAAGRDGEQHCRERQQGYSALPPF